MIKPKTWNSKPSSRGIQYHGDSGNFITAGTPEQAVELAMQLNSILSPLFQKAGGRALGTDSLFRAAGTRIQISGLVSTPDVVKQIFSDSQEAKALLREPDIDTKITAIHSEKAQKAFADLQRGKRHGPSDAVQEDLVVHMANTIRNDLSVAKVGFGALDPTGKTPAKEMEARFYETVDVERQLAEAKGVMDAMMRGVPAWLRSEVLPETKYANALSRFTDEERAAILNTAHLVSESDKKAGLSEDYVKHGDSTERTVRGERVFNRSHLGDAIETAENPSALSSMVNVYRQRTGRDDGGRGGGGVGR